jgi:opacity protein-like surface antigen
MAYARFFVYRSRFVNLYVRVGSGYGYITRKFDYLTNPTNNIISTNINMAVQIKMGMEWKLSPNVQLNTAFAFDHFSNSGANLPNYGANLLLGSDRYQGHTQSSRAELQLSEDHRLQEE